MNTAIINGKKMAEEILRRLQKLPKPRGELGAALVGNDPASISFLGQKQTVAKRLQVQFSIYRYSSRITQDRLQAKVSRLGRSKNISGIIVQLPLPAHIKKTQQVLDLIPTKKDVDVLSSSAFGKFATGNSSIFPPVAAAIAKIARQRRVAIKGKRAAVIGYGKLVGLPAAIWLAKQGATVLIANEWTSNLSRFTKDADIVVCGVGKPGLIAGDMIKRGAVIFDAGYGMRNGKPSGDCEFQSAAKKARLITPVPGGIGPLAVAMLFQNFYDLNRPDNS
jgi:methylenetetrahydrofolate dehydrogenase (NADP+)/methenyltetrahydrofolate cyclohydrolase